MLHDQIIFMLWLLVQSVCECGIFLASEGSIRIRPDGKKDYSSAMLLLPFKEWVCRYDWVNVYYEGEQLKALLLELVRLQLVQHEEWLGDIGEQDVLIKGNDNTAGIYDSKEVIRYFTSTYGAIIEVECISVEDETWRIRIYKKMQRFELPLWLRKPLIMCVTCMASMWSLPLYVAPAMIVYGWRWEWFALLPVNIGCVAFLNTYFYKRAK